ncbi:hypothetical protein I79_011867 [Cricetulus griseus]|uniref:Uncharacterized protein n=1 Tax=Cricetulus griseus TaxID=10029 RepID=G3HMB6_CRIGR|nr:hypothetical protein I79_011867 [Cricetulus griseus]
MVAPSQSLTHPGQPRDLRRSRAKVSFEAGAGKVRKPMLKSNPSTSLALERLYQHS